MELPFTQTQFFDVFRAYNETVYPFQVLFYVLAITATYLAIKRPGSRTSMITNMILASFWIWMGLVYHIVFFSEINQMAFLFGAAFILQGFLFVVVGALQKKISFQFKKDIYGITGLGLIVFALFIYPILGIFGGHAFPYAPTFGLPCPTTIFTFGLLLLTAKPFLIYLMIIPVLWSIFGISAALNFGVGEDWFLILAALMAGSLLFLRKRKFGKDPVLLSN